MSCNSIAHEGAKLVDGKLICPKCGEVPNLFINPYAFESHFPLKDDEGVSIQFWEFKEMEEIEKRNLLHSFGLI